MSDLAARGTRPCPTPDFIIRPVRPADAADVLGLFDEAVAWLVGLGMDRQWGRQPWSTDPARVELVAGWCAGPGAWVALTADGAVAGLLVLSQSPDYVPASDVPELYVLALVGSRCPSAKGAGRQLLSHAEAVGRAEGVTRLRVDCYAGNGGLLVAYYRSVGFVPVERFQVGDWTGQLLQKLL